jgi:hypothetical protein
MTPEAASLDDPELETTLLDSTLPTHRESKSDGAVGRVTKVSKSGTILISHYIMAMRPRFSFQVQKKRKKQDRHFGSLGISH